MLKMNSIYNKLSLTTKKTFYFNKSNRIIIKKIYSEYSSKYPTTLYCNLCKNDFKKCTPYENGCKITARDSETINMKLKNQTFDMADKKKIINNCMNYIDIKLPMSIDDININIAHLFICDENRNIITNIDDESGFINVSLLSKVCNKDLNKYMNLESTKELIKDLSNFKNNPIVINKTKRKVVDSSECLMIERPSVFKDRVTDIYFQEYLAMNFVKWCNKTYEMIIYSRIIQYNKELFSIRMNYNQRDYIDDIKYTDNIYVLNINKAFEWYFINDKEE